MRSQAMSTAVYRSPNKIRRSAVTPYLTYVVIGYTNCTLGSEQHLELIPSHSGKFMAMKSVDITLSVDGRCEVLGDLRSRL